jgi:hypothetical protein
VAANPEDSFSHVNRSTRLVKHWSCNAHTAKITSRFHRKEHSHLVLTRISVKQPMRLDTSGFERRSFHKSNILQSATVANVRFARSRSGRSRALSHTGIRPPWQYARIGGDENGRGVMRPILEIIGLRSSGWGRDHEPLPFPFATALHRLLRGS